MSVKDINIKNRTYNSFNDIIYIENFDPNDRSKNRLILIQKCPYLLHWIC